MQIDLIEKVRSSATTMTLHIGFLHIFIPPGRLLENLIRIWDPFVESNVLYDCVSRDIQNGLFSHISTQFKNNMFCTNAFVYLSVED